ncbi:glycoside hydrolase family 117 protein [Paenibacillus sp. strain BS8-2]
MSQVEKKISRAMKRAIERGYFDKGNEWFCDFRLEPVDGLGMEEGVHRISPSGVIRHNGIYYTWYTKSYGEHYGFGLDESSKKVVPWDLAEIWYAKSDDGKTWTEIGLAIPRGEQGCYDDRSVFSPDILVCQDKFYLVYQCMSREYKCRSKQFITIASSNSPEGPWEKADAPILSPANNGIWAGDEDNRFVVVEKGDFDSHTVQEPRLFHYQNKYFLYYKGERMGEELYMGGRETKWGLAIADNPMGPYIKSEYNPVTNSGHGTCLWKYKSGMAALLRQEGIERNTIQFAEDGINFEIMAVIKEAPGLTGPYRPNDYSDNDDPLEGINWGLTHNMNGKWSYIVGFNINMSQRNNYTKKLTFE